MDQLIAGETLPAKTVLQQIFRKSRIIKARGLNWRMLVLKGDLDDARTVLASIPEDTDGRSRPQNRLEFAEEAAGMDSLADLDKFRRNPTILSPGTP